MPKLLAKSSGSKSPELYMITPLSLTSSLWFWYASSLKQTSTSMSSPELSTCVVDSRVCAIVGPPIIWEGNVTNVCTW